MDGKLSTIIVKASYGAEIRKWKLNIHGGPKHADLINAICNEFGIEASNLHLKYKDSDGDYIDLKSDDDLVLAVELEKQLVIVASKESEITNKSMAEARNSLTSLIAMANDLFVQLSSLNVSEKKPTVVDTPEISSPVKTEAVATIEPSVLEEVQLNDGPNGTVHELKSVHDNGIQSFPIKNTVFEEPAGFGNQQQQQQPPLSQPLPPSSLPPSSLPPTSNFGQSHQQQFPSSGVGFGNQLSSYQPTPMNQPAPLNQQLPPSSLGHQLPPSSLPPTTHFNPAQQQHFPPSSNFNNQLSSQQLPPSMHFNQQHQPPQLNHQLPPSSLSQPLPPSSLNQQLPPPSSINQQLPPSTLSPISNFGQPHQQQFPPSSSAFGSHLPPQQMPPSMHYGQQPPSNPFQRPTQPPSFHNN